MRRPEGCEHATKALHKEGEGQRRQEVRWEVRFDAGQAELLLQARLELPQEPIESAQGSALQYRVLALDQIEALLPEVLSDLLYGRRRVSQSSETQSFVHHPIDGQ